MRWYRQLASHTIHSDIYFSVINHGLAVWCIDPSDVVYYHHNQAVFNYAMVMIAPWHRGTLSVEQTVELRLFETHWRPRDITVTVLDMRVCSIQCTHEILRLGAPPAYDISIEFEIRANVAVLWLKKTALSITTKYKTRYDSYTAVMCEKFRFDRSNILKHSTSNFDRISNSIEIPLVGQVPWWSVLLDLYDTITHTLKGCFSSLKAVLRGVLITRSLASFPLRFNTPPPPPPPTHTHTHTHTYTHTHTNTHTLKAGWLLPNVNICVHFSEQNKLVESFLHTSPLWTIAHWTNMWRNLSV